MFQDVEVLEKQTDGHQIDDLLEDFNEKNGGNMSYLPLYCLQNYLFVYSIINLVCLLENLICLTHYLLFLFKIHTI